LNPAVLDALIDEITVDASGEDEQLWAFRQALQDNVAVPCDGYLIGDPVSVIEFDYDGNERRGLTAKCRRKDGRQHIWRPHETGFRIGELSPGKNFEGLLPWGMIDNRPFLRPFASASAGGRPGRRLRLSFAINSRNHHTTDLPFLAIYNSLGVAVPGRSLPARPLRARTSFRRSKASAAWGGTQHLSEDDRTVMVRQVTITTRELANSTTIGKSVGWMAPVTTGRYGRRGASARTRHSIVAMTSPRRSLFGLGLPRRNFLIIFHNVGSYGRKWRARRQSTG
jgi:hypothetical protein